MASPRNADEAAELTQMASSNAIAQRMYARLSCYGENSTYGRHAAHFLRTYVEKIKQSLQDKANSDLPVVTNTDVIPMSIYELREHYSETIH